MGSYELVKGVSHIKNYRVASGLYGYLESTGFNKVILYQIRRPFGMVTLLLPGGYPINSKHFTLTR